MTDVEGIHCLAWLEALVQPLKLMKVHMSQCSTGLESAIGRMLLCSQMCARG